MRKFSKIKRDEETNNEVVKFIISNVDNVDVPSEVKVFTIDNEKINKIVNGNDRELLVQELSKILKELML